MGKELLQTNGLIDCYPALSRHLLEEAGFIVLIVDNQGIISEANLYATSKLPPPLTGSSFMDLVVNFSGNLNWNRLTSGNSNRFMLSLSTLSGVPESFTCFFYHCPGDRLLVIGQKDEAEVSKLKENLVVTNNELANKTREAIKQAVSLKQLNQQKNELIGMAAHDLRNPLQAINGFAQIVAQDLQGVMDANQEKLLKKIHDLSSFMKGMVDSLLDVSTLESGKVNLVLSAFPPNELVDEVLDLFDGVLERKEIDLEKTLTDNNEKPLKLIADREKVQQILVNLISNAIKFSPRKGKVKIYSPPPDPSSRLSPWKLEIHDTGPGIPVADRGRIFNPFEKGSASPTDKEKSTGLGLAITLRLVKAHGGTIHIDSSELGGAVFHLTLPRTPPE